MAYVITQKCVGLKEASCVQVCPVDCIQPVPGHPDFDTVDQLFINPDDCIDCGACMPACPHEAVFAEEDVPEDMFADIAANAAHFATGT
jgi:NAD-dependent dihydropyrimidine dehydrogenase PreA subunit